MDPEHYLYYLLVEKTTIAISQWW